MNRKRTIPETVQDDIAGFPPAVRTNLKKIGRRSESRIWCEGGDELWNANVDAERRIDLLRRFQIAHWAVSNDGARSKAL